MKRQREEAECSSKHQQFEEEWQHNSARYDISQTSPVWHKRDVQGTQHNPVRIDPSPEPELGSGTHDTFPPLSHLRTTYNEGQALPSLNLNISSASSNMYYAVASGKWPGIYTSWPDAGEQVFRYPGALHQKFKNKNEAWQFLCNHEHLVRAAMSRRDSEKFSSAAIQSVSFAPNQRPSNLDMDSLNLLSSQNSIPASPQFPSTTNSQITLQTNSYTSPKPSYQSNSLLSGDGHKNFDNVVCAENEVEPTLVPEQQHVVDLILQGHNVFYTGSAGCGKSTILKTFVKQLKARGKDVKIIAPTNLAALGVGGITTWSFAGWTPNSFKRSLKKLKSAAHGIRMWEKLNKTDVLVIDEISMVENHFFERLNEIMKSSREQEYGVGPFGNVQLVVTGDFCQLAPVKPFSKCIECGWDLIRDNQYRPQAYKCENKGCHQLDTYDIDKWAFRSKAWKECDFKHINLKEIHRQSDKRFISILQRIRVDGVILPAHARVLLKNKAKLEGAVRLYSRKEDVEAENRREIAKLTSQEHCYRCGDDSLVHEVNKADENSLISLSALEGHRYEPLASLRAGMRVVLQANLDPVGGLYNGSQGTIESFEDYDEKKMPRKAENGRDARERGIMAGDQLLSGSPTLWGSHARYAESQITKFAQKNGYQPWPVVQFDNGRKMTIYADCICNEIGNKEPYNLLSRTQIPLTAGYAITVHKSQGMTLDKVIVNLKRVFEASQIYVALSRARSLDGLRVEELPLPERLGANAQVREFFATHFDQKIVEP